MADVNLKKLAAKLTTVAGKRNLDSKDMEILREVKEGISGVLQGLKECESCGAAVTEIVRIELGGVRAAVCQSCGIKALKSKTISLKAAKKKEAARQKAERSHHESRSSLSAHKSHDAKPIERRKPFRTDSHPVPEEKPVIARPKSPAAVQPSLFGESAPAEKSDNIFETVANEAGSKIMTVKKVHQIASAIAFPMNMDRTLSYVRMDAQSQGVHLQADEIKRIITALLAKGLVKVKE